MSRTVDSVLAGYREDDTTVKLLWTVFGVIPGGPQLSIYTSAEEARMLVAPELDDAGWARAQAYLASPAVTQALNVSEAIDTGDVGITVLTGVRTALTFFFGDKAKALDTDAQQGADAALKAVAIAYLAHTLFEGNVAEKVRRLRALPTGEALLTYFAAVEVALPFADDVALGAGNFVSGLFEKYGSANFARLDRAAGTGAAAAAAGMLGELTGPLESLVSSVSAHTGAVAEAARKWLPPAIATAGTVASAAATAADALPVYRLLVARIAAEAALTQDAA